MRASAPLGLVLATLLAVPAVPWPPQDPLEKALRDYHDVRTRLVTAINERRAEEGLEPLSPEPRLTRAAQEVALAIARRMKAEVPFEDAVRDDELEERLAAAGYETHAFAARLAVSGGEAAQVAAWLMAAGRGELRRTDLPELGIGVGPAWRSRIYVAVAAVSAGDHFAAQTAGLADLEEVRTRLLSRINEARLEVGVQALEPDDCLERVAQAFAERMLAEGFFDHTAPEGGEIEDRVRAGGCPQGPVGENLAKGQTGVGEVAEVWLASPEHRRVLLESGFDGAGLGLAVGRGPDGYTTLWVQVVGGSETAAP